MKTFIIKVGETMFIPTCALMILYCLLYQYMIDFPYVTIIRFIFLISSLFILLAGSMSIFGKKQKICKHSISSKPIVRRFYLQSRQIVTLTFCFYFAVYLAFFLDRESVFYNYLVLLLFGLYLGYEIAVKANLYKKKWYLLQLCFILCFSVQPDMLSGCSEC